MTRETAPSAQSYTIASYLEDVSRILDRDAPLTEQIGLVTAAKKKLVSSGLVLPPDLARIHPTAPYTRNLIHNDSRGRFTVIAILWGAFQETAIHDHINWCVVGVLGGTAHVTNYDRLDDGSVAGKADLCIRDSMVARPGAVAALLPPPRSNIHRMSNAGRAPAITIHTYGDPGTRATVFDLKAGTYETIDLKFHNL